MEDVAKSGPEHITSAFDQVIPITVNFTRLPERIVNSKSNVTGNSGANFCYLASDVIDILEPDEVRRELKIASKKLTGLGRVLPLCPDHRDKVRDKPCRECEVEMLRSAIRRAIDNAGGRESEWGERAERSFEILEAALAR